MSKLRDDVIDSMTQIDQEYFEWLTIQIDIPNGKSYRDLFERMHNREFFWTVPNDDNRLHDGLDLRTEFLTKVHGKLDLSSSATMLEILVSLSRRAAFTAGGTQEEWAWRLLKNLRLNKMCDPLTNGKQKRVEEILDTLIWRTYERDGRGGFFPLKNALEDQTKIEIWQQMNTYINEEYEF